MARNAVRMFREAIGHRGHRIAVASAWSLVAKTCAAAHLFLSVPFVLHALGPAEFGTWATLVALVAFAGFLDFGIGNGAMNLVADAHGRRAHGEVAAILAEARSVLLRVTLALALPLLVVVALVPWHELLGLPEASSGQTRAAVAFVVGAILVSVPLNLANRAQLGLGRGERTFRWQAIGQLAALAVVVLAALSGASLVALTAAAVGVPVLASLANTLQLLRDPEVSGPRATLVERGILRHAIHIEGLAFFGLQLAAALAFTADLPLIASLVGPERAGEYAIAQRLFSVIPLCLSLVWAPLWPTYRHALAAGDLAWVARTLRRSLVAAVAFATIAALVLCIGFDTIIALWVRTPVTYSMVLVAGMGTWCVVEAAGTALSTFFNAASVLRYQLITAAIFSATCIAGKAWVLSHWNVPLMPWVTVTTYLLACMLPLAWYGRRLFERAVAGYGA